MEKIFIWDQFTTYVVIFLTFAVIAFLVIGIPVICGIKKWRKADKKLRIFFHIIQYVFMSVYIIFALLHFFWRNPRAEYYQQIDPVENTYTAFAGKYFPSFVTFYCLFLISVLLVFLMRKKLPPLALSLCIVFLIIGIVLNGVIIAQYFDGEYYGRLFNENNEKDWILGYWLEKNNFYKAFYYIWGNLWRNDSGALVFHNIANIFLAFGLIIKVIIQEKEEAVWREYANKFLNRINKIIGKNYFLWAFILLVPVFVIITLILVLFGQEKDALIKVWTDTTTWAFSQREHPPYLDHHGHYLCTVAARGHKRVVKPLGLGVRRGGIIIVNRQLQIANAFEEVIQTRLPRLHRVIRAAYDRFGYPVSKHIRNKYAADCVYLLMKPLEFFFLIFLYLIVLKPEKLIAKQYALSH